MRIKSQRMQWILEALKVSAKLFNTIVSRILQYDNIVCLADFMKLHRQDVTILF